jgi:outer membrane lipoprotein SlyB
VVAVRVITQRVQGRPGASALAGGVIGGVITQEWWGAAAGAATGALLTPPSGERHDYEVIVRFHDGSERSFLYRDAPPPFEPGQHVVVTENGLAPAG